MGSKLTKIYRQLNSNIQAIVSGRTDGVEFHPQNNERAHAWAKVHSKVLPDASNTLTNLLLIPDNVEQLQLSIKEMTYGIRTSRKERVVMFVGETGAGKSTLINGIANYLFGAEFDKDDRYNFNEINCTGPIKTRSQTDDIIIYKICVGRKKDYTFTMIDTPGFGDTRGIKQDKLITDMIRTLFTAKDRTGIAHIDAVCFVVSSSNVRLTSSQDYVFDKILEIFGKDIKKNIFPMFTFSDVGTPGALESLRERGIVQNNDKFLKFQNAALNMSNVQSDSYAHIKMFWDEGMKHFSHFFVALEKCKPVSLVLTREVLIARNKLSNTLDNLQEKIESGASELAFLTDVKSKKKFTSVPIYIREKNDMQTQSLNCLSCERTCHQRYTTNQANEVFDASSKCTICSESRNKSCGSSIHEIQLFSFVRTYEKKNLKRNMHETNSLSDSVADLDGKKEEMLVLIEEAKYCIKILDRIALRPASWSTNAYIDYLISVEQQRKNPGFADRVVQYEKLKQEDKLRAKIEQMPLQRNPTLENLLEECNI